MMRDPTGPCGRQCDREKCFHFLLGPSQGAASTVWCCDWCWPVAACGYHISELWSVWHQHTEQEDVE
jgi:hypothetical protein